MAYPLYFWRLILLTFHLSNSRIKRVLGGLSSVAITLLGLLALTFFIGRVMPIDPVLSVIGPDADNSTYEQVYQEMGLDKPIYVQYFYYLNDLAHGDFGNALLTGRPVIEDIARVFPATLELATVAIIFGIFIGIPLGVYAAVNKGRTVDHIIRVISLFGYSTPVFWVGMIGLIIFYAWLNVVGGSGRVDLAYDGFVDPVTGMLLIDSALAKDWDVFQSAIKHIILPAFILGLNAVSFITRMTRSFMLEQLSQEYILTAQVKGLPKHVVIWRHAFRNILVQLLTIITLSYGSLLEGAVLIETVFAWPGFGQYLTSSLLLGDMNAVVASVLLIGLIFISMNLLTDLLYQVFDPRTRK